MHWLLHSVFWQLIFNFPIPGLRQRETKVSKTPWQSLFGADKLWKWWGWGQWSVWSRLPLNCWCLAQLSRSDQRVTVNESCRLVQGNSKSKLRRLKEQLPSSAQCSGHALGDFFPIPVHRRREHWETSPARPGSHTHHVSHLSRRGRVRAVTGHMVPSWLEEKGADGKSESSSWCLSTISVVLCVCAHMCTWMHVCLHECGFRGQFYGPTFLLPSFGIWGSKSGYQAMSCTPVDHPAGSNLYIFSTKTIKGTKVIKRNFKLPLILYYWGHITFSFLELKVRVTVLFWLAALPWPSGWHVYSQEASALVL